MLRKSVISIFLIFVFLSALILSSCTYEKGENNDFKVVTSFYPVYVFTKNIAEGAENIEVLCMTDYNSGCLHDYQMLPSDIKMLEKSDLFIINGGGMEDVIEKVYKNKDLKILDSSYGAKFLHSEHNHAGHKEHGHDECEEVNSHIWMYIPNAIIQVKNITEALIKYNPENKNIFEENSEEYIKRLEKIHKKYEEVLYDKKDLNIIVADETFDYLAKGYGINIAGKISTGHNEQASARKLKELTDIINNENILGIFADKDFQGTVLRTLNEETSCPIRYLNSCLRGNGEYKDVYENNMIENLEVLITAASSK